MRKTAHFPYLWKELNKAFSSLRGWGRGRRKKKITDLFSFPLLGFSWVLSSIPIPKGSCCGFPCMLWSRGWSCWCRRRCILRGVWVGLHARSLSKEMWLWNQVNRTSTNIWFCLVAHEFNTSWSLQIHKHNLLLPSSQKWCLYLAPKGSKYLHL